MYIVLAFESTHQALSAEKALLECGVPIEVMPTPRSISSNCGLSIKASLEDLGSVQAVLAPLQIKTAIYGTPLQKGGVYEPLLKE